MTQPLPQALLWQFDFVWRLAQYHLPKLTDEMCLWEPAPGSWTLRKGRDGLWRPDWSDKEPDPAPPATIGWITWQMLWWWQALIAAAAEGRPVRRELVFWPGSAPAAAARLEDLHRDWRTMLADVSGPDLEKPINWPWAEPRPLGLVIAWANAEPMKNVAEIGCLRHQFEAFRGRD